MTTKRRIAVVTPFLDKRHGTERCVAEQIERLARDYGYEVHLYSQRVEDVDRGGIVWHRVPAAPGPGLMRYLWWFAANYLRRWWDARVRGVRYDVLYSPGVNCLDADAVNVHIVYAAFRERVRADLVLCGKAPITWLRILHRRLYYRLIAALERRVYGRDDVALAAVSRRTADELAQRYRRDGEVSVIYNAVDSTRFTPQAWERLRAPARRDLQLPEGAFVLLLVGNDLKNKGLPCLLEAAAQKPDPRLFILVVGKDDPAPIQARIDSLGLGSRVRFLPVRPDVEFYYAAADAYVGPSLEDAFALPPAEAMACGLPVIVSSQAGVSEIISDGVDGLILRDPRDAKELARLIRGLVEDADLRHRLGEQAVHTAQKYTWERNAAETAAFLENAMRRRCQP